MLQVHVAMIRSDRDAAEQPIGSLYSQENASRVSMPSSPVAFAMPDKLL